MRTTSKSPGEKIVNDIKRATWKQYSSEVKIRIVLDGLRGEDSIDNLCRSEGISQGIDYKWSKDFMEAGKRRQASGTARAATTDEVRDLRREARDLKEVMADQKLELRLLKKSMTGMGATKKEVCCLEHTELNARQSQTHLNQLFNVRRTYLEGLPKYTATHQSVAPYLRPG